MYKIRSCPAFFIVLIISISANAQHIKPKFKNLTVVAYSYIVGQTNNRAFLNHSAQFDADDSLRFKSNNFTRVKPGDHRPFKFGMTDTTYVIPDALVAELNKFFSNKKPLKSHMITDKLPNGEEGYDGEIFYISYTNDDGVTDTFIAVPPFLDKKLNDLINQINTLPRGNNWALRKTYRDAVLEEMIEDFQKTCSYVPKPTPPKIMDLRVADPGINH